MSKSIAWFCILLIANEAAFTQPPAPSDKSTMVISGKVSDEAQLPVSGASISISGKPTVSLTDSHGLFVITVEKGQVIEISHVGYQNSIHKISDTGFLQIVLRVVAVELEDVVLVGYNSTKVKEITGAVSIVKPRELLAVPAGQVEQMLQGRVAGLNVVTSGMPGGASTISIRGVGNFGDVRPLYIIDGIQGDINILNPGDIESIQVLKDAGAYAVYGVRGANGVIIVETKKGKTGKPTVSYDFYVGYQLPAKNTTLLSSGEVATLTWQALRNSGELAPNGNPSHPLYGNGASPVLPYYFSAGPFQGLAENDPRADPALYNIDFTNGNIYQIIKANQTGTDWWGEVFNPAFSQNHSVNIAGGSEKNKYLFGMGYLDQKGTLSNTYLRRFTARINSSYQIGRNIQVGQNLQLTLRDSPKETDGINKIFVASTARSIIPVYDINGNWASSDPQNLGDNAVAIDQIGKENKSRIGDLFGNVFLQVNIAKDFKLRSDFGGNLAYGYAYNFIYAGYTPTAAGLPNNVFNESSGYNRSYTWTNSIEYAKHFKKDHTLKIFAAIEAISSYNRNMGGSRSGLFFNDPAYRFLINGAPSTIPNYSIATASSLLSYIGKLDYNFREKYLFSFSLRRDGSSLFGKENRFGWFPSVSAAWRMIEENFLRDSKIFTDVKIRASIGKTGFFGNTDPLNQYTLYGGTPQNAYYDIFGVGSGNIQQGFTKIRIGNPSTGWQEDEQINVGVEASLWKGVLYFNADWYKKTANGLLFPVSLPDLIGGAVPPNINVGKIDNSGFDVLLGTKGTSRSFTWDLALTLTTYKNIVRKLNDLPFFTVPGTADFVRNQTGQTVNSYYGYKVIGFFEDEADVAKSPVQPDAKQGRFKYLDADKDGLITDKDRVFFGDANPDFTLGTNINLSWKQFDFSVFFYGSFGNEILTPRVQLTDFYTTFPGLGRIAAKSKTLLYDSWTPTHPNPKTSIAENSINFSNVGVFNSYLMHDGSYFRCKSIVLGYSFKNQLLEKIKVQKLRVYVQAANLLTFTQFEGVDPEIGGSGIERYGIDFIHYPNNQQQFLFGINLSF